MRVQVADDWVPWFWIIGFIMQGLGQVCDYWEPLRDMSYRKSDSVGILFTFPLRTSSKTEH